MSGIVKIWPDRSVCDLEHLVSLQMVEVKAFGTQFVGLFEVLTYVRYFLKIYLNTRILCVNIRWAEVETGS